MYHTILCKIELNVKIPVEFDDETGQPIGVLDIIMPHLDAITQEGTTAVALANTRLNYKNKPIDKKELGKFTQDELNEAQVNYNKRELNKLEPKNYWIAIGNPKTYGR